MAEIIKIPCAISLSRDLIYDIDEATKSNSKFRNRSHFIEEAVKLLLLKEGGKSENKLHKKSKEKNIS